MSGKSGLKMLCGFVAAWILIMPANAFAYAKKKHYVKALKKWSRQDEQYQRRDFYASIGWEVTLLSPEFQNAQIEELARTYEQTESQIRTTRRDYAKRFGGSTVFFVSFYAYDHKGSELDKKNALWKMRLEVDGQRYDPVKIEQIKKVTPLDSHLFPYIRPWSRHYYIYFPGLSGLDTADVKLIVNGPYSQGTLSW